MAPRLFNASMGEQSPPQPQAQPQIYATGCVCIENGAVSLIELAAGLSGAVYEDGWLMVSFSNEQDPESYLIFPTTDEPVKIERFKSAGYFELVFTKDGEPANPGCVNLQIVKVR